MAPDLADHKEQKDPSHRRWKRPKCTRCGNRHQEETGSKASGASESQSGWERTMRLGKWRAGNEFFLAGSRKNVPVPVMFLHPI